MIEEEKSLSGKRKESLRLMGINCSLMGREKRRVCLGRGRTLHFIRVCISPKYTTILAHHYMCDPKNSSSFRINLFHSEYMI